ncbi:MAG: hypothetical protein KAI26_01740 [Nanoarchaeota archaeon]|nr:hypothetical protein [Nanoarchaeota archaeon]
MKEPRDKTLTEINNLAGLCKNKIRESSLSLKKGVYQIGEFEVKLTPSLTRCGQSAFDLLDFWKKGKKDQESVGITSSGSLIIFGREKKTILSDDVGGLQIREHIYQPLNKYPKLEFIWIGELIERIPRGTLSFARVDLSGSDFVNYNYGYNSLKYTIYNPRHKNIYALGLPYHLEETCEILGTPFAKVINFDEKKKEILKGSGLEDLVHEINSCT